jgi:hypothetical protein
MTRGYHHRPGNVLFAITKRRVSASIAAAVCVVCVVSAVLACVRTTPVDSSAPSSGPSTVPVTLRPSGRETALDAAPVPAPAEAIDARAASWSPLAASAIDGPHQIPLEPDRPIYYALPKSGARPFRLVGHLHGICGPPVYACGKWLSAGVEAGVLVCPTGNARCGDSPASPASWEAPSWNELVAIMDHDLEAAVAKVEAKHQGAIDRTGAILTGYSRGAYAAAVIARRHKDRWPYLVLIEANVSLTAASLRAAGVRAVALVGGELGNEIAGERTTVESLEKDGFPARLFVMKKTGHLYSDDMEYVMHDALSWVKDQR